MTTLAQAAKIVMVTIACLRAKERLPELSNVPWLKGERVSSTLMVRLLGHAF